MGKKDYYSSGNNVEKNIFYICNSSDDLIFHESSTLITSKDEYTIVNSIIGLYNLTIIGDIQCNRIETKGDLVIIGDVKVNEIDVKSLVCSGNIECESLSCNDTITARSITGGDITCYGNVLVEKDASFDDFMNVDGFVFVGNGITGNNNYSSKCTVAGDFFDIDARENNNYIEVSNEVKNVVESNNLPIDYLSSFENFILEFNKKFDNSLEEEGILDVIDKVENYNVIPVSVIKYVFSEIIEISYQSGICSLNDYIYILFAKKYFNEFLLSYETVEPVFNDYLNDIHIDNLEFNPKNDDEFALLIYLIGKTVENKNYFYDKLYTSIGPKYDYVSKQFIKNQSEPDILDDDIDLSRKGRKVKHQIFGEGIIQSEKKGCLNIYFKSIGMISLSDNSIKIIENNNSLSSDTIKKDEIIVKPIVRSEFIGKKVRHVTFGVGTIIDEIESDNPILEIDFGDNGKKKMQKSFVINRTDKIIIL